MPRPASGFCAARPRLRVHPRTGHAETPFQVFTQNSRTAGPFRGRPTDRKAFGQVCETVGATRPGLPRFRTSTATIRELAMAKDDEPQTKGREANAAQKLGERRGAISKEGLERTGRVSRQKAGPDGPDSAAVGKTFKAK
jgi:hypothetical protein